MKTHGAHCYSSSFHSLLHYVSKAHTSVSRKALI
jgi:hypothetical protein